MPYLLLGADEFSKKSFVDSLVAKLGADLVMFGEGDTLPTQEGLSQTDLFSKGKIYWFRGLVPDYLGNLGKDEAGKNRVVVTIESLDKRKKESKDLLNNKNIEVKEFALPHGQELDEWIIARVKSLSGKISAEAANELAIRLGRDQAKESKFGGKVVSVEEVYNLWQAENEISKLIGYAAGQEISAADVNALVSENGEVDVFELTNAIAENQKQKTLELMERLLKEQVAGDEKASIIQLNALLSEQFRNVAMVQDFAAQKTAESEILEKTGWKSGRLFVMKKIAARFPIKKVLELLAKLRALDEELKSSSTPPRVLLDLIIAQLF